MADAKTMYGVGGKLLKAVQNLKVDNRACVEVGMNVSGWFETGLGDVSMIV